jgi:hypothetical protein
MVKDLRLLRIKNNLLLYRWRFVENHQEKVLKEV